MATTRTRDRAIVVPILKPRVKELNKALVALGGGLMKNPKDRTRAELKLELKNLIEELE